MSKTLSPVKATKGGRTIEQPVKDADQRSRWIELFKKNGWRVVAEKGL